MISDVVNDKYTIKVMVILICEILSYTKTEREIVEANKRLIEIYEGKIKQVIARVWDG